MGIFLRILENPPSVIITQKIANQDAARAVDKGILCLLLQRSDICDRYGRHSLPQWENHTSWMNHVSWKGFFLGINLEGLVK
jgi:hypothetical protein